VTKLHIALLEEQHRQEGSKDNHFSRRLAGVDMQHKLIAQGSRLDSMKEAIDHLNAAQGEHDDMSVVVSHLKSAVSKINSFVNENQGHYSHGRRSLEADGAAPASAAAPADFRQAVQCVAQAALENDIEKFVSCSQLVKQGIQTALNKVDSALVAVPPEQLEELAKQWSEAQNDPAMQEAAAAAMEDPSAIAAVVTTAIEHILETPAGALFELPDLQQDFQQLFWMVPISVVWGGVLWMFTGLWNYGPEYGIIGSLWFEITWILSGLGCWFDNVLACGTWNP
jgi:hypothetical protein